MSAAIDIDWELAATDWTFPGRLLAAGISVAPATIATKQPHTLALPWWTDPATGERKRSWNPYRERYPTPEEILRWPRQGADIVAAIYGNQSRAELYDIDLKGDRAHLAQRFLDLLQQLNGDLFQRLVIWRSKSGGLHIPIRYEGDIPGNHVLAYAYSPHESDPSRVNRTVLIETRGEGGYGICWTMAGCEVVQGDPSNWPFLTEQERDLLADLAGEFAEGAEYLEAARAATAAKLMGKPKRTDDDTDNPRPGDIYNESASLQEVLELLCTEGATVKPWRAGNGATVTRPGKNPREGTSGDVAIINGMPILVQFSTSWSTFEPGKGYAPFGILAAVKYGGDYSAAAKGLYAQQHGPLALVQAGPPATAGDMIAYETPPLSPREQFPEQNIKFLLRCIKEEEYGDSQLLKRLCRNQLVYDHAQKKWFFWGGHRWCEDRTGQVYHLLGSSMAAVYLHGAADMEAQAGELNAKASQAGGDASALREQAEERQGQADALTKRARDLRKRTRMVNVLNLAQPQLPLTGDEWDSKPDLLAVANGVIDLTTGELHAGKPEDYLHIAAPTWWAGIDAPAPLWERFVGQMFRTLPDNPAFVQRWDGYSISGHTTEHHLAIWHGAEGRNGKDTHFETIGHVLGEAIAGPVNKDVLISFKMRSGGAEEHLTDLQGKRVGWVSESNEGARLNAGQVKNLTGGGMIVARGVYEKMRRFPATHSLNLLTNHMPDMDADDEAMWSRPLSIECKERFVEHPDPNKEHEHARDPALGAKLREEASGILAWLVRGHLEWRAHGLQIPDCVRVATRKHREKQDTIARFVKEACIEEDGASVGATALFEAYQVWAGAKQSLPAAIFGERMALRFPRQHTKGGNVYRGLRLRNVAAVFGGGSEMVKGVKGRKRAPFTRDTRGKAAKVKG